MLPYLVVLAAIPVLNLIIKPAQSLVMRKLFVWLVFGGLAVLAMVRSKTVGVDTMQFVNAYEEIGLNKSFSFDQYRYEYGFTFLCRILNNFSHDSQLLIIVSGAFIMLAVGYAVYHLSVDVALSAFIFVAMNTYFSYLNVMRQAIAIGFILFGYCKIRDRKYVSAILFLSLAPLFHQSAWLAFLVLLVVNIPFTRVSAAMYLMITAIMFVGSNAVTSFIATVMGKDRFYDPNHSGANYYGALIQLIFILCVIIFCFFYMPAPPHVSVADGEYARARRMYQHVLMLWLMFVALGVKVEVMSRFGYFFGALALVIVPFALLRTPENERLYVKVGFCMVCVAYFLIVGISRPEWYGAIPYRADLPAVMHVFKDMFGL